MSDLTNLAAMLLGGVLDTRSRVNDAVTAQAAATPRPIDSGRLADMDDRLEKLTMVCLAMWELVKTKTDLTDKNLMDKVTEIDLSDGQLDGRVRRTGVFTCAKCGRTMSARRSRCMYCGSQNESAGPFDAALK